MTPGVMRMIDLKMVELELAQLECFDAGLPFIQQWIFVESLPWCGHHLCDGLTEKPHYFFCRSGIIIFKSYDGDGENGFWVVPSLYLAFAWF